MLDMTKVPEELRPQARVARVCLEKKGLSAQKAKVALVLDISGSMDDRYRSGNVQELVERVLALGVNFDDDGAIDVFLFGVNAHNVGELRALDFKGCVDKVLKQYRLEPGTNYATVVEMVCKHYEGDFKKEGGGGLFSGPAVYSADMPVYVIFVTDGDAGDHKETEKALKLASHQPIFWQFMGVGSSTGFHFLEKLDNLPGRFIDNANFFPCPQPHAVDQAKLYDMMMGEFPAWLKLAAGKKMLP